jgi:hypothetical protein
VVPGQVQFALLLKSKGSIDFRAVIPEIQTTPKGSLIALIFHVTF